MEEATRVPGRFLRTPEAGRLLGLSSRTLEKHRTCGTGPRYRKLGGRVVYAENELLAWADAGLRLSTTDPAVLPMTPPDSRRPFR
jgi:predicted DNA-binding transcriptional regulator AlpA